MWATIFHISYVEILQNEPFSEIRGTVRSISDWVSEKIHFKITWEKMCQIVIISHNSAQFESKDKSHLLLLPYQGVKDLHLAK